MKRRPSAAGREPPARDTAMVITWTTDFGADSPYVAQMKAAVLQRDPEARFVDITHSIPPQNVAAGALVLEDVARRFPTGTIHVAVVDPGVGTSRRLLAARADGQYWIGPDNGLLSCVLRHAADVHVVELTERRFWNTDVSATFHGRDIMAPVAARLALGTPLDQLGPPCSDWLALNWPLPAQHGEWIQATSLAVDSFGNIVTNVTRQWLDEQRLAIVDAEIDQQRAAPVTTYGEAPPGTLVCLFGSSDRLELAVVNGDAARKLGHRVGSWIRFQAQTRD